MISITLARKPLIGTVAKNVLTHGTGGINIDGSRIGGFLNRTPSGANRFNARLAELGYRPGDYQQAEQVPESPPGRWPSNLILMHRAGCRKAGRAEVKTGTAVERNRFAPDARDSRGATVGRLGGEGSPGWPELMSFFPSRSGRGKSRTPLAAARSRCSRGRFFDHRPGPIGSSL